MIQASLIYQEILLRNKLIIADGEVDQPVYEEPQTWSCTKALMKANILMDRMFDIHSSKICDVLVDVAKKPKKSVESIKDLILQFWYQQAFTVYTVCCDLAAAGTCSINC